MPRKEERRKLLFLLKNKMKKKSFIFWMSQRGKYNDILKDEIVVRDGWYLHPRRHYHSFYTEFETSEIDKMMKKIDFNIIKPLGKSGHDQFRLYSNGGSWL